MSMIQNFFGALPYFVILIGLLIFVHESGHFIFAKLFNVKVHVFSLGFGPKLFGFVRGETQYKISLVPVGGYVKMLGEDPTESVPPEDRGRAFGDKPLAQRFIIIIAGPLMNIIFPLFLHFGVGLSHTELIPAEAGMILPNMPAHEAGMVAGDIVESVNGKTIASFEDLLRQVSPHPGEQLRFAIRRGDKTFERTIVPRPTEVPIILDEKETVGRIGIGAYYLPPLIGVADPASPAAKAGLQTFDLVLAVDGQSVGRLVDLEHALQASKGNSVSLSVKRLSKGAKPPFQSLEGKFEKDVLQISLAVPVDITALSDLGIDNAIDFIAYVNPDGIADKIGLQRGDRLVSLDGKEYGIGQIYNAINQNPTTSRTLVWTRNGTTYSAPFKPAFIPAGEAGDLGLKQDRYDSGFKVISGVLISPNPVSNQALVSSAIRYAIDETWAGIRIIGIGFKLLFQGDVSMRSLGGPLMIGQLAGQAGQAGASTFIWIMALISLNLGLLNLLPIPVLDGGQIVFIAVEAVTRQPISHIIKERIMLVGVAMLLVLMLFATWNDIARILVG
jgi:regulator of sigma E protease